MVTTLKTVHATRSRIVQYYYFASRGLQADTGSSVANSYSETDASLR